MAQWSQKRPDDLLNQTHNDPVQLKKLTPLHEITARDNTPVSCNNRSWYRQPFMVAPACQRYRGGCSSAHGCAMPVIITSARRHPELLDH